MKKFVAYYRVSTHKQGQSGLGLEAQQQAVTNYLKEHGFELLVAFTEIETGKGANALEKRPELLKSIEMCRKQKATLIIAKLDRLARNIHFVSGLIETGCDFIAADMPHANKVMIQMHAVMSEWERDQISIRTKAALDAARNRGAKLGKAGIKNLSPNIAERKNKSYAFALRMEGVLSGFHATNMSQRDMVKELNQLSIPTIMGRTWSLTQVQRVINTLQNLGKK